MRYIPVSISLSYTKFHNSKTIKYKLSLRLVTVLSFYLMKIYMPFNHSLQIPTFI